MFLEAFLVRKSLVKFMAGSQKSFTIKMETYKTGEINTTWKTEWTKWSNYSEELPSDLQKRVTNMNKSEVVFWSKTRNE